VTPIFYFILLKCLMKDICCLIFHLKLPFPLLKNRQFVFPPITYCFRVKILKSIWSNFQSSFRIIYWFIFWQCTPKQILIKDQLSPHIKYEISISMKYLIQTNMSLLILSNLSPINLIRSFWKQSFNLNSILARCTKWMQPTPQNHNVP
jgi:hypothetical protein